MVVWSERPTEGTEMKLRLVSDWRNAWKWFSMNCMVLAASIQSAWMCISADLKAAVPSKLVAVVTVLLLAFGAVGRMINQKPNP